MSDFYIFVVVVVVFVVFFFKQKTAYEMCGRDWSSDVCSSDLKSPVSLLIFKNMANTDFSCMY